MDLNANDETDLEAEFFRSAPLTIEDILRLFDRILWKRREDVDEAAVLHKYVRTRDLASLVAKIDTFQEDPQLLDVHLQSLASQLASAYLTAQRQDDIVSRGNLIPLPRAISKILYMFCKVRGEKIIVGLLNNEPRYLELLLTAVERLPLHEDDDHSLTRYWEERYVLLLWLSHLLLAPFDLSTISTPQLDGLRLPIDDLTLPLNTPDISRRIIPICIRYLSSPTREQIGAASLLVRLCLRPDMQKLKLHHNIIAWVFIKLQEMQASSVEALHSGLGCLQFLARLVSSGSPAEIGQFLPKIYELCRSIREDNKFRILESSAIAQKLVIKISRNIASRTLHTVIDGLSPDDVLADFIELLLQSLGHSDSLVRMAASKSLSLITQQLDAEVAQDVIDAVLDSFQENVIGEGTKADYTLVNPLRWHGLTLTLSHLLYRRAVLPDRLPDVIVALLLALNFEQRSTTGMSTGTNVRDAANFGIWAVARRYRTDELLEVEINSFKDTKAHTLATTVIQILALELLKSACHDPAGNVRRGSSAALQELIGRHPNTVQEGISLTQTIDYHVVSLLRNSIKAASDAARLGDIYWYGVFDSECGWRGVLSLDSNTRNLLTTALYHLSEEPKPISTSSILDTLISKVSTLNPRNLEEWHGLIRMASGVLQRAIESECTDILANEVVKLAETPRLFIPTEQSLYSGRGTLTLLLTVAIFDWLCKLTTFITKSGGFNQNQKYKPLVDCMELCLRRFEGNELGYRISNPYSNDQTGISLIALFDEDFGDRAKSWLAELYDTGDKNHISGLVLALGATEQLLYSLSVDTRPFIAILSCRCSGVVVVEARIVALRALGYVIKGCEPTRLLQDESALEYVLSGILCGLNDRTITERGDVGSKVRIEALNTAHILTQRFDLEAENYLPLAIAGIPLALEKLDKVREAAWGIRFANITLPIWSDDNYRHLSPSSMVISKQYFADWLLQTGRKIDGSVIQSIILGYCTSASGGSESVMIAAREGLISILSPIPTSEQLQFMSNFVTHCRNILQDSLKDDRIAVPLLQTLAFIGDLGYFKQLEEETTIK